MSLKLLSWVFGVIFKSGLTFEIVDQSIVIRGGNYLILDEVTSEALIHAIEAEAGKYGDAITITCSDMGLSIIPKAV